MGAGSELGDSCHIESHAALLHQPDVTGTPHRTLDAIIVPTIRPQWLREAAELARGVDCALVVLCSTPEQAADAWQECRLATDALLVTYLPPDFESKYLSFLTSVHPEKDVEPSCHIDIARKRNAGLLLARLCCWRTIMFLDDDIRGLSAAAVSRAADMTASVQAAGFKIGNYPDHSVVCHAHRLTGGDQDIFPGGSAMLINVAQCDRLFPPIYNEDWLFLFDAVQDRSVAVAGTLSQLEYQPFAHSKRAASEEFGDVIAEGLYRLIHEGVKVSEATQEYWGGVLERRLRLIDDIAARLQPMDDDPALIASALMSLAAARKRLAEITPLACVSFTHAWRTDLSNWRERLQGLPPMGELAGAAKFLNLPTVDSRVTS